MTIRFKRKTGSGAPGTGKIPRLLSLMAVLSFGASLWGQSPVLSPTTLSVLGGGGPEHTSVTIASGVSWSAASNVSWITFPSGNSGTGSGSLNYQVAQNASTTTGQTGVITVTSSGGSATLTVNESAFASGGPTAAILNLPTSGILPSQANQTLTFEFGSPNGPGYLYGMVITINNVDGGTFPCVAIYYPQYNNFYFLSDFGVWTDYALGAPGPQASSDHCKVDIANSSVTLNPSSIAASVTMSLALTLQPSAVGTQNIYLQVYDDSNTYNSGQYSSVATWTAFNLVTTNPPAVSLASPPVNGASQTLHYKISDGNGYTYLDFVTGQLAPSTGSSPCWFYFYFPNSIALYQIANGTWTLIGEGYLGGSWSSPETNGIIGGSGGLAGPGTCSINLNQSSISSGTDGTGVLQDPNAGTQWQPVTTLYLDLSTALDSTAQTTMPLTIDLSAQDVTGAWSNNSAVGTWISAQPPPTTTSLSPIAVTAGAGPFTLTVTGTNFVSGAVVNFNGVPKTTAFVSSTQVTATILTGDVAIPGSYPVTVTTGGGTSNAQTFTVNPPQPTTTSLSPTSATAGAGQFNLTVYGTNFVPNAVVNFNGAARSPTYVSSTQVTATILTGDVATAGSYPVTVTTTGGTSNAQTFTVSPPRPTTTSLSPTSATAGAGQFTLTVNGTNFVSGAVVNFNATARSTTYVSSTQVTATILTGDVAAPGSYPVTVTTAGGTSNAQTFTVNPAPAPALTTLSPTNGVQGATALQVTLTGSNFTAPAAVTTTNGSIAVVSVTVVSQTQINATFTIGAGAPTGPASVTVTCNGATSGAQTFTVQSSSPTLTSVTPSAGVQGTPVSVTLTGANFTAGAAVTTTNSNIAVGAVTVVSATQIATTFTIGASAPTGTANVVVTTASGASGTFAFTVNASETVSTPPTPTTSGGQTACLVSLTSDSFTAGGSTSSYANSVEYLFNWGDGTYSPSGGPSSTTWIAAGTQVQHAWYAVGNYQVTVQARSITAAPAVSPWSSALQIAVQDFSLQTSAGSSALPVSNNATFSVAIGTICYNGFSGTINFGTFLTNSNVPPTYSPLPGYNATFAPQAVPCGQWTTMSYTVEGADGVNYPLNQVGATASSDGGQNLTRSVQLGVQVVSLQPFSLSGAPQQTVTPGGTAQYGIAINCDPGFSGTVSLSTGADNGFPLPPASNIALSPTAVSCAAQSGNPSGSSTAILTIATTASTPTGTCSIRITGAGGSTSLITGVQLIVNAPSTPGFTVQASPASQQLIPGGSTQAYTVTATGSNGFHDDVGLSVACVPAAVKAALAPNPITAAEGYSGTVTMTLAASQTNLIGDTATCTLTGTGDSATASATVWAQIVSAPAQYLLTTTVNPPGAGTITPSGWYDGGLSVPVSATPNGSYVFTGFTGGLTGATSPQYVTMNGPVSVTANFVNPTGLRVVSSTPYFLPFSVDGTPCATGSCLFSAQSGGDTLTVTQTAPPLTGRAPVFQYSAPDGSVAPQEVEAPPVGSGGGGGCPWTCRNGSCSAPIPVGSPQPAPVIASVTLDAAGQIPAVIVAGVPTTIYINGTNFETVPGIASFCIPGDTYFPCTFNANITVEESISSWTNTQIVDVVTMDPNTPPGLWWMFLNVPFWIPAGSGMNPSMGSVEVEAGPTLQITQTTTGANITGTTQSVLVSQWVDLTAVVVDANGATPTFSWTQPPGNTAINWIDTADNSTDALVPIKPSELSSNELYFAWTDTTGTGQPVSVTATLPDGTTLRAQVTYNITLPEVTVGPVQEQTPTISLSCPDYDGETLAMCLYQPAGGTPGIAFNATVGCGSPNVNCEWEQVINSASDVTIPTAGQACALSLQSALDGGGPQQGGAFANDSPSSALIAGEQEQTDSATFSTFLMYRANSNFRVPDGVWVPLWRVDWQWSGDAYLSAADTWSLRSGNPATTIQAQATSSYPTWTNVFYPDAPPPCVGLPILSGVAVSPSQVASGGSATITVTLAGAAPAGGAAVSLSASSAVFSPQATCNVSAGATIGTCSGTAGTVTSSTPVTVTATYYNSSRATTVTVVPQQ